MEPNENELHRYRGVRSSRMWTGLLLVAIGGLLLAYKMGAGIPEWVFTWPVLLLTIGFLIGIKSRFRNPGAFIMIIIGGFFLIDHTNPNLKFHDYIIPAILITIGFVFIVRPVHKGDLRKKKWRRMYYDNPLPAEATTLNYAADKKNNIQEDNAEYVEINTAFGSVKKVILSKNFKGGEINNFMGGTEINLMKADIQQPISLEINNVFGGAKLIVPSNWDVKNEVTAVFGGIEDKRTVTSGAADPGKVIILKGACVFGGIEITNY